MKDLSLSSFGLFLLLAFPGLVSAHVYRLIMPARELKWGEAAFEALFYSAVNFVLSLPVLWWLLLGYEWSVNPGRFVLAAAIAILVGPILWPIVLVRVFKSARIAKRIQIPYPTAWDFFFDKREPAFALVHLNTGDLLGALWGDRSYAALFPNDGDIYFEAVYRVVDDGTFGERIPNTRGVLLRRDQYRYIEVFSASGEENSK
jgi:hypothetical protein